ncbi:MAG: hypothetical protein SGJ18_13730 [Pseudomonadota bacterium]|nr:hypothetical protein [Pseudomonadota bacterium]
MDNIKTTVKANLKDLITKNFGYKVVSFLAALALWSGFVGRGEFILDLDLGVNYLLPSGMTLQSPSEVVKIKMKGPEMAMKKYSRHIKTVTIDLFSYSTGTHQVRVTRKQLELPPGIQILEVKPEFLDINLVRPNGVTYGN